MDADGLNRPCLMARPPAERLLLAVQVARGLIGGQSGASFPVKWDKGRRSGAGVGLDVGSHIALRVSCNALNALRLAPAGRYSSASDTPAALAIGERYPFNQVSVMVLCVTRTRNRS